MYFSFSNPVYLTLLFLIPLVIFIHFFSLKNLKGRSLKFANFEAIARIRGADLYSKSIYSLVLNTLIILFLVFGISGMVLYKEMVLSDFSFVIAIDNSFSMTATDLTPNRLEAAKLTARNFVDQLPYGTLVGVISFSGQSNIEKDLTRDKDQIKTAISNIEVSEVYGTDILDAVGNSGRLLKNEKNKAIVLLSDGQINIGNFYDVIDYSKLNNLLVHTIAIGTVSGGNLSYGLSKIDEDGLKSLSYNTQGKFFRVNSNENLKDSFDQIIGATKKEGKIELSSYLIIASILLFLFKQFLDGTYRIAF